MTIIGTPWVEPLRPFNPLDPPAPVQPAPQFPDPQVAEKPRCPKCGMQLDAVMGYVCGDLHCPTFLKAIC